MNTKLTKLKQTTEKLLLVLQTLVYEEIIKHCQNDIRLTHQLFKKISKFYGISY